MEVLHKALHGPDLFFLFSTSPAKGVENKERRKDRKKGKNKQDPAIVKRRKMMKILEN